MQSDLGFSAAGAAGAGAVGAGAVGTMVLRVLVVVADLIREPAPSRGRQGPGQGAAQGAPAGAAAAAGGAPGEGASQGLGQGGAGPSREAGARAASAGPSEAPSVRSPPATVSLRIFPVFDAGSTDLCCLLQDCSKACTACLCIIQHFLQPARQ